VSTTRAAAVLGLAPQTLLRWNNRGLGPQTIPRSYLKPTKGDPIYYRYHDVKAWAAERFGQPINFAEDVMGFISRHCPNFSKDGPAAAYACQFDYYYRSDFSDLRRGRKLRFFDEDLLMRFEDLHRAQPKRTILGQARDDLRQRLDEVEGRSPRAA
jgi:hypothetical protein